MASMHKLLLKLRSVLGLDAVENGSSSAIIERDYEESRDDGYPFTNSGYGTFESPIDHGVCSGLGQRICETIHSNRGSVRDSEILIPQDLLSSISKDVLRMSEEEPCGIRGCILYVNMEERNVCRKLGKLVYDPNTVSTFEVYLTLKEDLNKWGVLSLLLRPLVEGCLSTPLRRRTIVLSPGYQLAKKKLYCSN